MPTMRALYSLISRARTACALLQATMILAFDGWAALTPVQLLVLGCGLCIILRTLVPSPPPGRKRAIFMDHFLSVIAAVSVIALTGIDGVGSCLFVGRLALGL
jgi:hypothetical protein